MKAKLLEDLIRQGHQVAVRDNDWKWNVFLFINWNWEFEWTIERITIDKCMEHWLNSRSYTPKEIENYFTDEYKVVTPTPKLLEVWDTVEILENVRENVREYAIKEERYKDCSNTIWQKWLEIRSVYSYWYLIWTKDKSDFLIFPTRAVAKCESDTKEDDVTMKAIQLLKEKGYKIVKE